MAVNFEIFVLGVLVVAFTRIGSLPTGSTSVSEKDTSRQSASSTGVDLQKQPLYTQRELEHIDGTSRRQTNEVLPAQDSSVKTGQPKSAKQTRETEESRNQEETSWVNPYAWRKIPWWIWG